MSESKSDLAEWLLEQYAATERTAQDCIQHKFGATGYWGTFDRPHLSPTVVFAIQGGGGKLGQVCDTELSWIGKPARDHIAMHDPAFVLADLAAKRAVVVLHGRDYYQCGTCAEFDSIPENHWQNVPYPCPTLLALAQPFRGRPGWRDDWAQEVTGP